MNRELTSRDQIQSQSRRLDQDRQQQSRRGPSGAWNRLKPVITDPLDAYGLPSKGEHRLHDYSNQEAFYTTIVERYMKFCASSNDGIALEEAFASLAVQKSAEAKIQDLRRPPLRHQSSSTERPNDLPNILMAMRKLREGILGSRRSDNFAQRAYMFIIHASILTRQWESYQPALLHLLLRIHPQTPLLHTELQEFVGYHILDLACRQNNINEALLIRHRFHHKSRRTTAILQALIHDDWPSFWRVKRAVDGYQRALMQYAEDRIRLHALKCIGRSYMHADRAYVERCTAQRWDVLVKDGVGWQLGDHDIVTIRKPKSK